MQPTTVQVERKKFRVYSWTGAALVVASVIALNFGFSYIPLRVDTSAGRAYSISEGTRSILNSLEDTLLIRVAFSNGLPPVYEINRKYLLDLLSEYRRASGGKIRIEQFDPGQSSEARSEALSMGVANVQLDTRERDRMEVKEGFMGVGFLYGGRKDAIPLIQDVSGLEYEISLRINHLVHPEKSVIGIASNGGAVISTSPAVEKLAEAFRELYDVRTVDLTQPIPEKVRSLWLVGPTKELEPGAGGALRQFLAGGGSVGLLLDRYKVDLQRFKAEEQPRPLDGFLSEYGIRQRDGFVVDPQSDRIQIRTTQGGYQIINVVDYYYFPWVTALDRQHPATKMAEGLALPFVSPFEVTESKPGLRVKPLARSSGGSFLDASPYFMNPMQAPRRLPSALEGPFDVALVVEGQFGEPVEGAAGKEGRLILFGTSKLISNDYPFRPPNYSVVLNLMDWSVQNDALLSIRSRGVTRRPLRPMSDGVRLLVKYAMMAVPPLLSLVIGLFVWRRQKARHAALPLIYREASS